MSATKQFFVERAPMVLCIALKRFSLAGGKLSKHVQFRKKISLSKYTYNKNTQQQLVCLLNSITCFNYKKKQNFIIITKLNFFLQSYKLVSLVTHLGPSQNCGHYTAIGQAPNGNYYQFDDSCVRPLPLSAVLGTNAYIMFFEKDNTTEDGSVPTASTSSAVYGPQLPDNILNREKSPLKLTFYRNEDRKPALNSTSTEATKPEVKPIILNSTLSKSSDANPDPWVLFQNGDVEKVTPVTNGKDKSSKPDEDNKLSFLIKRKYSDDNSKPKPSKNDSDLRTIAITNGRNLDKAASTSKLVKQKSPLEKLEEQMNRNDSSNHSQHNGNSGSKLVPYDSESSGDERNERLGEDRRKEVPKEEGRKPKPSRCESPQGLVVTTKGMHHAWTVSNENNVPLLSPSLNGDTIKKYVLYTK